LEVANIYKPLAYYNAILTAALSQHIILKTL